MLDAALDEAGPAVFGARVSLPRGAARPRSAGSGVRALAAHLPLRKARPLGSPLASKLELRQIKHVGAGLLRCACSCLRSERSQLGRCAARQPLQSRLRLVRHASVEPRGGGSAHRGILRQQLSCAACRRSSQGVSGDAAASASSHCGCSCMSAVKAPHLLHGDATSAQAPRSAVALLSRSAGRGRVRAARSSSAVRLRCAVGAAHTLRLARPRAAPTPTARRADPPLACPACAGPAQHPPAADASERARASTKLAQASRSTPVLHLKAEGGKMLLGRRPPAPLSGCGMPAPRRQDGRILPSLPVVPRSRFAKLANLARNARAESREAVSRAHLCPARLTAASSG
jgi:hypothetical protein